MKREARIIKLMKDYENGRLSRNRHFDAFSDPDVSDARQRSWRLQRLWSMLDQAVIQGWEFELAPNMRDGGWTLVCHSKALCARWTAHLQDFEVARLGEHPESQRLLRREDVVTAVQI